MKKAIKKTAKKEIKKTTKFEIGTKIKNMQRIGKTCQRK